MKTEAKPRQRRKIFALLWILGGLALLVPFLLIYSIAAYGDMPTTEQLENPKTAVASEILSADGVVLGKFYSENRTPIQYEELGKNLTEALIATEDARYLGHSGIDFRSYPRVMAGLIRGDMSSGGGSTLTQQLAKNLFPRTRFGNPVEKIVRKLKEWIMAVRLERFYTKEEILAMYLNTVSFGGNAYGIKAAARTYFNKSPKELNVEEAAVLVGMLKAPTYYSPVSSPERSKLRRNVVLHQMKKYGYMDAEQFSADTSKPLVLQYSVESHNQGLATYFREQVREWAQKWASEHGYDLYSDGLKIHTGIDSKMQQYAEDAVTEHLSTAQANFYRHWKGQVPWKDNPEVVDLTMKRSERYRMLRANGATEFEIRKSFNTPLPMKRWSWKGEKDTLMSPLDSIKYYKWFLHTGFMVMDPHSGQVRAWVGGANFKYFKYDHVNESAKRQVGSTFKPFVYTAAIMNGYSPCMEVPNVPVVFDQYDNWSPKNSDGKYGGKVTLRRGLAMSINTITAWTMKEVGIMPVVRLAQKMGIKSKLEPVPSLSLGTADISVSEMTGAFNVFNNGGTYLEPMLVTRIEDKNGNILHDFVPKPIEALDEKHAYIMVDMLKGVTNGGTGSRLRYYYKIQSPLAGKTGTTQNHSDGWFMGLTPQLTGGVWVGADDRAVHFRTAEFGQGNRLALPIWGLFLQKAYADKSLGLDPAMDWTRPEGDLGVELNCTLYEDPSPDHGTDEFTPF